MYHLDPESLALVDWSSPNSTLLYAADLQGPHGVTACEYTPGPGEVILYDAVLDWRTVTAIRTTRSTYSLDDRGPVPGPLPYRLLTPRPIARRSTWRDALRLPETFVRVETTDNAVLTSVRGPQADRAITTIMCTAAARRAPEPQQYLPQLVKTLYSIDNWKQATPVHQALADAVRAAEALDRQTRHKLGWGMPPRGRESRHCRACGRPPPNGKYRWRNRICTECRPPGEEQRLWVTEAGRQVHEQYPVPNCYPGQVCVAGEQLLAPPEKLEDVDFQSADVYISSGLVPGAQGKWFPLVQNGCFAQRQFHQLAGHDTPDDRRLKLVGYGFSGVRPTVCARTCYVGAKSMILRAMLRPKYEPEPGIWERVVQPYLRNYLPHFDDVERMSDAEWLASMPPNRRRPLSDAQVLFSATGWHKTYEWFHSFPKSEKGPAFKKGADPCIFYPATHANDRLIQGPHDVTHVIAGPWIKPCVGVLKRLWHENHYLFYGSTTPRKLQVWLERVATPGRVAFWTDLSAFDNSHNRQTWDTVHTIYRRFVRDDDFWTVLAAWESPKARMRDLKYEMNRVLNASGRDDTAFANGLLNGLATLLSFCAAWNRLPLELLSPEMIEAFGGVADISITGDDTLGFMDDPGTAWPDIAEAAKANLGRLGFTCKAVEASRNYCEAVYLGMRPLRVQNRWTWVKTLGRCLYKFGWRQDPRGDDQAWYLGVCEQVVKVCRNSPVLFDIAEHSLRLCPGAKRTPYQGELDRPWDLLNADFSYPAYDQQTIHDLCSAYPGPAGQLLLTPAAVQATIRDVRACRRLPVVLADPVVLSAIWADDL